MHTPNHRFDRLQGAVVRARSQGTAHAARIARMAACLEPNHQGLMQ